VKYQRITEDQLDLMHLIQGNTNSSQRQIAKKSGLSIGKVNYCIKALVDIGFIKVDNFSKSTQKINYAYILTPKGIKSKTAITKQFIIKKKQEYDKLNSYIDK
jgi:EPS-associated MarR family transcriptional regulator